MIGGVTVGSNGNLYALSTDPDTVFQLSPPPVHGGPWVETVLRSFAAPDHLAQSNAALPMVMVDAHTLLGTMSHGGPLQGGAVFQLKF